MGFIQSNKAKFIAMIIVAVLFLPISWKLALKNTFDLHKQINEINKKHELFQNAPEQIAFVEKRLNYLTQLIVNDSIVGGLQNRVLDEISTICKQKGLLLKEMPPMFRNLDNNYLVETINIQVAGSFNDLVELTYLLEQPTKHLNIVSVDFFVEENKRLKTKQLILSLYIQTLKPKV
jgi:Tfp pilus assembly protein PilO